MLLSIIRRLFPVSITFRMKECVAGMILLKQYTVLPGIRTCEVLPIEGSEYPAKATRPFYSVMNKKKIKETYSVSIPYWENSLVKCINLLMK